MQAFTFYDLLAKNIQTRAEHPALIAGVVTLSYAELLQQVKNVAATLVNAGVGRGDRVGVHLNGSIEEVVAMFAAARIGAVFVNISARWTIEQLDYVVKDCDICCLFVDSRKAFSLVDTDLAKSLKQIIVKGKCPEDQVMVGWPTSSSSKLPAVRTIDEDIAAILYTSGSSGKPKGVVLTNLNLIQGARSISNYLENVAQDRLISLLPFSFDYGLSQLTSTFLCGATLVLQKVMMPAEIVKTLRAHKVTGFAAVPPAWIQVVNYLVDDPSPLPHLRYVTNTGGKIPDDTLRLMPEVFPGVDVFLMYGLTEAFRSTYLPPQYFLEKMGSIGNAIPNVEIYIVDPGIGVCGPGQQGELVHRGSLISRGYWGNPEATSEKIRSCPELEALIGDEKVLFSGDIVRIDEDGFYWFVGRNDALIKCSGFRISPTEVEDIVSQSKLVGHVIAFGIPDELNGQSVCIIVTTKDDSAVDELAIKDYCRRHMPSYMVPTQVIQWQGEMPKTGSGKLDRPKMIARSTK